MSLKITRYSRGKASEALEDRRLEALLAGRIIRDEFWLNFYVPGTQNYSNTECEALLENIRHAMQQHPRIGQYLFRKEDGEYHGKAEDALHAMYDIVKKTAASKTGSLEIQINPRNAPTLEGERELFEALFLIPPAEAPVSQFILADGYRVKGSNVNGRCELITEDQRQEVLAILKRHRVAERLQDLGHYDPGRYVALEVEICGTFKPDDSHSLHHNWARPLAVDTPEGFPRQKDYSDVPANSLTTWISCIRERTGGMGAHYLHHGYFLSLIIDMHEGEIYDARGEVC